MSPSHKWKAGDRFWKPVLLGIACYEVTRIKNGEATSAHRGMARNEKEAERWTRGKPVLLMQRRIET